MESGCALAQPPRPHSPDQSILEAHSMTPVCPPTTVNGNHDSPSQLLMVCGSPSTQSPFLIRGGRWQPSVPPRAPRLPCGPTVWGKFHPSCENSLSVQWVRAQAPFWGCTPTYPGGAPIHLLQVLRLAGKPRQPLDVPLGSGQGVGSPGEGVGAWQKSGKD